MGVEVAVDNDVLIKTACYSILAEITEALGGAGSIGVLGAAKFVVRNRLSRRSDIRRREAAIALFEEFLQSSSELEPTEQEISFATAVEEAASRDGLALDNGESQLCAIVLHRALRLLITGDKRAISALERTKGRVEGLSLLDGRVGCLEQLIMTVVVRIGGSESRTRICSEPDVDKAISICFACNQSIAPKGTPLDGLRSYIAHLRGAAPTVLHRADDLLT